MAKRNSGDRILFIVTVTLVVFGLLMVFSSSAILATEHYSNPRGYFWRQMVGAAFGVLAMLILMRVDYRKLRHPDRKSTRLNSSHIQKSRMPSSA